MATPPGEYSVPSDRRNAIIKKFNLPVGSLDSQYDYSYQSNSDGQTYMRGGKEFIPPFGFDKLGLSTVKFDNTDFMDSETGWHVAYHGTDPVDVPAIIQDGLKAKGGKLEPKHGAVHGNGIYCSDSPLIACSYAGEKRIGEQETSVVLMVRVRPGGYSEVAKNIWLVTDPDNIRCTNILFRR
jgi:hypothetical protein